ncbi:hypothetical protein ACOMHN_019903 [Nucella lapillus]
MGRLLLWLSLSVCTLAMFFSLNSLAPVRSQLFQNIPNAVKQFFSEIMVMTEMLVRLVEKQDRLFTKEVLSKYTGQTGGLIYIAILGHVYDVTRGKKHYGPGGGYEFFSGRDGSRAFVSGDFTEKGLTDDVSGFTTSEALSLQEWETFYQRDYTYVDATDATEQLWAQITKVKDCNEAMRFQVLPRVMLGILLLPVSNAACERVFSVARRNRTVFRSSMGKDTTEALLVLKSKGGACFENTFADNVLTKCKAATKNSL